MSKFQLIIIFAFVAITFTVHPNSQVGAQLVRNGVPYRARDEVQFLAPNISVVAPDGYEIDPNAEPERVNIPIEVGIKPKKRIGGDPRDILMPGDVPEIVQPVIVPQANVTTTPAINVTTTVPATNGTATVSITGGTATFPALNATNNIGITYRPGVVTVANTNEGYTSTTIEINTTVTTKKPHNSANGNLNYHPVITIILSAGLAIYVANKKFFI